jgi:hypothetical protein
MKRQLQIFADSFLNNEPFNVITLLYFTYCYQFEENNLFFACFIAASSTSIFELLAKSVNS